MSDPWPLLRARYDYVREAYLRWKPEGEVPPFPEGGDPNAAIMVIDQMLAPMQGRQPTVIRLGKSVPMLDPKERP